jgi:predicted GIY-YIG superfamily endonuclease
MKGFYYAYILVSETDHELHYSGLTRDLNARLAEHNHGKCPHTAKYKPWKIETAVAFRSEAKARDFERYLKTGSGREFAHRHFLNTHRPLDLSHSLQSRGRPFGLARA